MYNVRAVGWEETCLRAVIAKGSTQHSVLAKRSFLAATVTPALEVENQMKHYITQDSKLNFASLEICEMLGQQVPE